MITDIRLQQFRSYTDESFELSPGVNIIIGPNASGKTNLLEALLVIARGSSYRAKDQQLIGYDKEWARLEAHSGPEHDRIIKLTANQQPGKLYDIDGKLYRRLTLQHTLPVVIFEPNHLLLLTGSPDIRRAYLDDLLEQTITGYHTLRRNYRRALAQRNALLKQSGNLTNTDVFPWNVRLSELGGQMVDLRCRVVQQISDRAGELYSALAGIKTEVQVAYKSSTGLKNYASHLLTQLEHGLPTDKLRGFTGHGPHRDDLEIILSGQPLQFTASRGETRTAVLMLKIVELQLLEQARGSRPIFLLDDVFSELDGARRQALTRYLQDYQVFITTTDADVVIQHFTETATIIPLGGQSG
jgi:DNA replication and repair protein RecF